MTAIIRGSDNFDSAVKTGLGDGQTWQTFTASRVAGTTYTNTTGRSIFVNIYGDFFGILKAYVGAIQVNQVNDGISSNNMQVSVSFIVPDGEVYHITTSLTPAQLSWKELR